MTTKTDNTELAKGIQIGETGMQLRTLADMKLGAELVIASGLAPEAFKTPSQVMVAWQAGFELGMSPWQALNCMYVVDGRVGIHSTAIGGLIRSKTKAEIQQTYEGQAETDAYAAVIRTKRPGEKAWSESRFSIGDAKRAGLWGRVGKTGKPTAWVKYPDTMLMWRALSQHGRRYFGDVLSGLYTREELIDWEMSPDYHSEGITEEALGVAGAKERARKQVEATQVDEPHEAVEAYDQMPPEPIEAEPEPADQQEPAEVTDGTDEGTEAPAGPWICGGCKREFTERPKHVNEQTGTIQCPECLCWKITLKA